jgi:hypothetical protein
VVLVDVHGRRHPLPVGDLLCARADRRRGDPVAASPAPGGAARAPPPEPGVPRRGGGLRRARGRTRGRARPGDPPVAMGAHRRPGPHLRGDLPRVRARRRARRRGAAPGRGATVRARLARARRLDGRGVARASRQVRRAAGLLAGLAGFAAASAASLRTGAGPT